MINSLSKSQIDHLGNRLREKKISEEDLRLLDEYRRSYGKAYETVVADIRQRLNLEPTGRPAKSTSSIMEKLQRESIRLTQIQDIAGCRIVLSNLNEQDRVVKALTGLFPKATIVDRRKKPSHGYRAVHVIADFENFPIEIQIRTALQHLWAELSEKLSDIYDPSIKYGGDYLGTREFLDSSCVTISKFETLEQETSKDRDLEPIRDFIAGELLWMRQENQRLLMETIIFITNNKKQSSNK